MTTISLSGCLSTYWYAWTINCIGSVLFSCVSVVVTIVMMKFISNQTSTNSSISNRPINDFPSSLPPPIEHGGYNGGWDDNMMGEQMLYSYA